MMYEGTERSRAIMTATRQGALNKLNANDSLLLLQPSFL